MSSTRKRAKVWGFADRSSPTKDADTSAKALRRVVPSKQAVVRLCMRGVSERPAGRLLPLTATGDRV